MSRQHGQRALLMLMAWFILGCAARPATEPVASNAARVSAPPVFAAAARVDTGGLWVVPVSEAALQAQPPTYQGKPVWMGTLAGQPVAVIGLGLTDAGPQRVLDARGETLAETVVNERQHAEQHLKLAQTRYVSPDAEQLARFEREAAEQKAVYRVYSANPPHAAPAAWPVFQWPLQGRISSLFGLRRFFNGEPRAPHLGVDIAGPEGAPVSAPAAGRVVLTGDYFFNGRTVIIDHGQGLFSMLCHFSRIDVQAGDVVTSETRIGLVGATGRATAPHLHWTVSLNDARIDPRRLLQVVPDDDR